MILWMISNLWNIVYYMYFKSDIIQTSLKSVVVSVVSYRLWLIWIWQLNLLYLIWCVGHPLRLSCGYLETQLGFLIMRSKVAKERIAIGLTEGELYSGISWFISETYLMFSLTALETRSSLSRGSWPGVLLCKTCWSAALCTLVLCDPMLLEVCCWFV